MEALTRSRNRAGAKGKIVKPAPLGPKKQKPRPNRSLPGLPSSELELKV